MRTDERDTERHTEIDAYRERWKYKDTDTDRDRAETK